MLVPKDIQAAFIWYAGPPVPGSHAVISRGDRTDKNTQRVFPPRLFYYYFFIFDLTSKSFQYQIREFFRGRGKNKRFSERGARKSSTRSEAAFTMPHKDICNWVAIDLCESFSYFPVKDSWIKKEFLYTYIDTLQMVETRLWILKMIFFHKLFILCLYLKCAVILLRLVCQ